MLVSIGRFLQGPQSPILAGLVIAQLLALHVPGLLFLILFVGIVAAFLVLVRPWKEALTLLVLSGLAYAGLSYILIQQPAVLMTPLIYMGAPALLAYILRRSNSLALALLGGFMLGWVCAVLLGTLPMGLELDWQEQTEMFREQAREAGQPDRFANLPLERIGLEMMFTSMLVLFSLQLLLARVWQSALAQEPFFGSEYRGLRYGRTADLAFLIILTAAWLLPDSFLYGLALMLVGAFLFPATALMHRLAKRTRYPLALLTPFYVLMLVRLEMVVLFTTLSAADDLLGLSRRLAGESRP